MHLDIEVGAVVHAHRRGLCRRHVGLEILWSRLNNGIGLTRLQVTGWLDSQSEMARMGDLYGGRAQKDILCICHPQRLKSPSDFDKDPIQNPDQVSVREVPITFRPTAATHLQKRT